MAKIAVYATDLHGEIREYERLLETGSGGNVRAVIIGGDICPFLMAAGDIALHQREFIQFYLIPRLRDFRQKTGKDVFLIMGNDDMKVNRDMVEKGGKECAFSLVDMKAVPLGDGHFIAGYSHINEAPFLLKDWEKPEEEILADLRKLAKKSDPKKTIYAMHAPPFGTALDIVFSGKHVGSMAIRKFIEEAKPCMTLHGHIHESPRMSGAWMERIGDTACVNPGKGSIVVFDVDDPVSTMQRL
ncbi:MAG: metallophosphoesterase [Candidatus Aenigmatarchaeota archaeon]